MVDVLFICIDAQEAVAYDRSNTLILSENFALLSATAVGDEVEDDEEAVPLVTDDGSLLTSSELRLEEPC